MCDNALKLGSPKYMWAKNKQGCENNFYESRPWVNLRSMSTNNNDTLNNDPVLSDKLI